MYIIYSKKKDTHYCIYEDLLSRIFNINNNCSVYVNTEHNPLIVIRLNDKVILSDSYNVDNPKVIIKLKLYNNLKLITYLSEYGRVAVLEWLKNSGLPLQYDDTALRFASSNGQVAVLEWWKNSGLELKYNKYALNYASCYGEVAVLEWWKNSGLPLKYSEDALDWASHNGHQIAVLEWWKNSGLELKYSEKALNSASYYDQFAVLKWWKNSGLPLK
uniref:Ankyrin repeat protein n=1 Tax=viral metagenome TaxID=1070528 RepID=A0A6C0E880_9ZZZZ